jgi:glyoxylase I family protein
MPAPFTIIGLDHVVLRARDPAALEKFYTVVLGCTLELRQGKLAQLRAGRTLIDIVPDDEAVASTRTAGANLDHLCLRIEPFDAAAIARHLAAHGVQCGEEASRYGAEGRGRSRRERRGTQGARERLRRPKSRTRHRRRERCRQITNNASFPACCEIRRPR